jgi:hypothetical protein
MSDVNSDLREKILDCFHPNERDRIEHDTPYVERIEELIITATLRGKIEGLKRSKVYLFGDEGGMDGRIAQKEIGKEISRVKQQLEGEK